AAFAPCGARAALPARRRPRWGGSDAAAVHGAGGEPARVSGTDSIPRAAGRAARARRPGLARPARALVSAQASVAVGLPAAPDELRRLRRAGRAADRLFARRRRR